MRGLSGAHSPSTFSDFSGPVIQAISMSSVPTPAPTGAPTIKLSTLNAFGSVTGRARVTLDDIALTLNAYNFIVTAVKFEALIRSKPSLSEVLLSFAPEADRLLDQFFDEVAKSEDSLRVILDVRKLRNLNVLAGAMDKRLISVSELVHIHQVFGDLFMKVLRKENMSLYAKVNSLLPEIQRLLINISAMIESDLSESDDKVFGEIKYPRYGEVIGQVNPIVNQVGAGQAFLHQLPVQSSAHSDASSGKLEKLFSFLKSL
jgi:hypothetical protein